MPLIDRDETKSVQCHCGKHFASWQLWWTHAANACPLDRCAHCMELYTENHVCFGMRLLILKRKLRELADG